ncbi:MAG: sialate O-acetylesterase [Acutalibacteraceae bacterium]|jgi:sialate O-acetylesterase
MIRLPEIFSDGVTLQREKPIRLWGYSDCPQQVLVFIGSRAVSEEVSINGKFEILLPSQKAEIGTTLLIEGSVDRVLIKDVNIGEVWIAGGQSNMEFRLEFDADYEAALLDGGDDNLRFFDVGKYSFFGEKKEGLKDASGWDRWLKFSAESAKYFSAVGYYFAKKLRERYGVPVAVIGCNRDNTSASVWLDRQSLEESTNLRVYIDEYKERTRNLNMDEYLRKSRLVREAKYSPEMQSLYKKLLKGNARLFDELRVLPLVPKFLYYKKEIGPLSQHRPGGLYNSMVLKIAGFACRGVIFYQGEADAAKADIYAELFTALIKCWRCAWEEDLPFLFVQLAPFSRWELLRGDNFPIVRQQQEKVSKTVPGAYMVSIMDAGMEYDIHPKMKRPVGERLALSARGKVYGEDILCEPPEFKEAQLIGDTLIISFNNAGEGLYIEGEELNACRLFDGRNEIEKYTASVSGDVLNITDKELSRAEEVEIRFAFEPYCEVNLYNSAQLPCKPFKARAENRRPDKGLLDYFAGR